MPKRPDRSRVPLALACLLLAVAGMGLAGCLGLIRSTTVAATVGDVAISEEEVTDYIEGFRSKNENCETDEGWASFLATAGYTTESMRAYVLETAFIPKAVVRANCATLGISVSDEELDRVIEQERAYYEQRYGADSWASVLSSYGYDEESWRENEEDRLLEERCKAQVVGEVEPTQSQFQAYVNQNAVSYNGKHSYYLRFEGVEEAQEALGRLGGTEAEVSLARFGELGEAVNGGWSSVQADQDNLSTAYIAALNELEAHHVSEPVEDGEGVVLILCNRTFSAEADAYVSAKKLPHGIREALREDCATTLADDAFEAWLEQATEEAHVVINDMPAGLPYDVNVALSDD